MAGKNVGIFEEDKSYLKTKYKKCREIFYFMAFLLSGKTGEFQFFTSSLYCFGVLFVFFLKIFTK